MARAGTYDLVQQLRGMCNAGTAEYTVGIQTYWSDDQLEQVLDRHMMALDFVPLSAIPRQTAGGSLLWTEYRAPCGNLERGTALVVQDSSGATASAYTADYNRGVILFSADQSGTAYYLTGRSFDMNGAAAEVWTQKASQAASSFDWSSDNHSVKRSQLIAQAQQMARFYANAANVTVTTMYRADTVHYSIGGEHVDND